MKILLYVFAALLLIVGVVGGAWAVANFGFAKSKVNDDTVYGSIREIVVKSGAGDVDLVPARRLIDVRETQHWVLSKPKVEQSRRNGVLTIVGKCSSKAVVVKCYSDLRVSVPPDVKVTVDSDSGDIDLRGTDTRGVHAESDSGDIQMDLTGRQGLVFATTGSGAIDLVTQSVRSVFAQADSGDVNVDVGGLPRRIVASADSGNVDVVMPRGVYKIRAVAKSGDAKVSGLTRKARSRQTIDASSDSGYVNVRAR